MKMAELAFIKLCKKRWRITVIFIQLGDPLLLQIKLFSYNAQNTLY